MRKELEEIGYKKTAPKDGMLIKIGRYAPKSKEPSLSVGGSFVI